MRNQNKKGISKERHEQGGARKGTAKMGKGQIAASYGKLAETQGLQGNAAPKKNPK